MRKDRIVALVLGLALTGCALQHNLRDLSPSPAAVSTSKIPGSYVVVISGKLDQPIKSAMMTDAMSIWGFQERRASSETSIFVGEPLRRTVSRAIHDALEAPRLVESEVEARAAAGQGAGAIIISFVSGAAYANKSSRGLSMVSLVSVILEGSATVIRPGGKEETITFSAGGDGAQTTHGFDQDLPATKAATESAITAFAVKAVSTVESTLGSMRR